MFATSCPSRFVVPATPPSAFSDEYCFSVDAKFSAADCAAACERDATCMAWTLVRSGHTFGAVPCSRGEALVPPYCTLKAPTRPTTASFYAFTACTVFFVSACFWLARRDARHDNRLDGHRRRVLVRCRGASYQRIGAEGEGCGEKVEAMALETETSVAHGLRPASGATQWERPVAADDDCCEAPEAQTAANALRDCRIDALIVGSAASGPSATEPAPAVPAPAVPAPASPSATEPATPGPTAAIPSAAEPATPGPTAAEPAPAKPTASGSVTPTECDEVEVLPPTMLHTHQPGTVAEDRGITYGYF